MTVKPATAKDDRIGARPGYGTGPIDADARTAMNAAFEAMSEWRDDLSNAAERHSGKVFDKMGTAAKAAGWPDAMVESTKSNMQQMSKMQLQMMDQVMDAWTEQMKSPGKFTFGAAAGKGFPGMPDFKMGQGMPNFPGFPGMPQMDMSKYGFGTNPMAPFQFWMEASQMWQKQWADAMASWMNAMPGNPAAGSQDTGFGRKPTTFR